MPPEDLRLLCQRVNDYLGYRGVDPEFDQTKRSYTGALVISKRAAVDLLSDSGRLQGVIPWGVLGA